MVEKKGRGAGRQFRKGESGNPAGRPKKDFLSDPNRYWFAVQNTLIALGRSQRASAKLVAGLTMGRPFVPDEGSPHFDQFRRMYEARPPGTLPIGYYQDIITTTADGRRAALIKELANLKQNPDVAMWLHRMTEAMMIAFRPRGESDRDKMLDAAAAADELSFAFTRLIPLFERNLRWRSKEILELAVFATPAEPES